MNNKTLLACTVLVALASIVSTSACHFADVEALEDHMVRRCFTAPLAPSCATFQRDREAQLDFVVTRFAQRNITRAETEQCILDVDCSEERREVDNAAMIDDIHACMSEDPGAQAIGDQRRAHDEECVSECDFALMDCGNDDDDCDLLTINNCYTAHEACITLCPGAE